jgi:hypothetical protein
VRLFWLGERNPRRVPGAFRFPFGPVPYMDAGVMLSLYREIFQDRRGIAVQTTETISDRRAAENVLIVSDPVC